MQLIGIRELMEPGETQSIKGVNILLIIQSLLEFTMERNSLMVLIHPMEHIRPMERTHPMEHTHHMEHTHRMDHIRPMAHILLMEQNLPMDHTRHMEHIHHIQFILQPMEFSILPTV